MRWARTLPRQASIHGCWRASRAAMLCMSLYNQYIYMCIYIIIYNYIYTYIYIIIIIYIYTYIYNYMNLHLQEFCIFVLLMIFCVQRTECVKLQLWPWPTTGFPLERPWASRCCPPLCWRSRSKEERDRAPESGWRWEAESYWWNGDIMRDPPVMAILRKIMISQWFFLRQTHMILLKSIRMCGISFVQRWRICMECAGKFAEVSQVLDWLTCRAPESGRPQ